MKINPHIIEALLGAAVIITMAAAQKYGIAAAAVGAAFLVVLGGLSFANRGK